MKYKPTLDEYREIGAEFRRLNSRLVELDVKVQNSCGKKYSLRESMKRFNVVRSALDDRVFEQYPDDATPEIFYGVLEDIDITTKKCGLIDECAGPSHIDQCENCDRRDECGCYECFKEMIR